MLFIGEIKVVHFLLKGVQYLSMSGHVSGQDEGDNRLKMEQTKSKVGGEDIYSHFKS